MTQSIDSLCEAIRNDLVSLPEVQRIYDEVPNAISELPAVVVVPLAFSCHLASHGRESGASPLQCVHTVQIEVHVPRKDLPNGWALLGRVGSVLPIWLYSGFVVDRFDGTMITTGDPRTANNATAPVQGQIGPSEWAGMETLALVADFQVTTEQEVTR